MQQSLQQGHPSAIERCLIEPWTRCVLADIFETPQSFQQGHPSAIERCHIEPWTRCVLADIFKTPQSLQQGYPPATERCHIEPWTRCVLADIFETHDPNPLVGRLFPTSGLGSCCLAKWKKSSIKSQLKNGCFLKGGVYKKCCFW